MKEQLNLNQLQFSAGVVVDADRAQHKKLPDVNRPSIETDWMTTAEAAAYLKVKPRTLLAWVRQGQIKAYPLSGTKRHVWRFLKADLDAALLIADVVATAVINSDSSSVARVQ